MVQKNGIRPKGSENKADIGLQLVLSMLPLHAEEGGRREILAQSELIIALIEQSISEETATALVWILRRQFEALALLDPLELHRGGWAFVSFPASLLARSWLTTLTTPEQALFSAGYWEHDAPEKDKEEQRALLHKIESARVQFNPNCAPIRVVHVAWALIKLGDRFLMHRREDKARLGEKSFGLLGGRLNLYDLPAEKYSDGAILKELFKLDSQVAAECVNFTLEREMEEEAGLVPGVHYSYIKAAERIPPYFEVNGAGNRHAYSAYQFHLYYINLTFAGETYLLTRVSQNPALLSWFSAKEICAPQRPDGSSAYVNVLHQAWGRDCERILSAVPESSPNKPTFNGESMTLDLPGTAGAPFQLGKPGKERSARPQIALEETEWQMLMLLGWHARGYPIQLGPGAGLQMLGNGWIEARDSIPLVRSLQGKIDPVLRGLIEIREDRFVALRISSEILYFPVNLFRYQIRGNKKAGGELRVERLDFITPWALLKGAIYERDIHGNTVSILRELEKGDDPVGDWERTLRDQLGEGVRAIGLRRLWSTKKNTSCLADGLLPMSSRV